MMTAIEAQIPERLAQQAQELVRDGWAADFNAVLVEALRRFLESHRPELTEAFLREDYRVGAAWARMIRTASLSAMPGQ